MPVWFHSYGQSGARGSEPGRRSPARSRPAYDALLAASSSSSDPSLPSLPLPRQGRRRHQRTGGCRHIRPCLTYAVMPRRRKPGRRTATGRLSRARANIIRDTGTPEGVRNRTLLINGSAPELAGSAVGILLANHHITAAMAKAADEYARLRAVSFGIARPDVAYDLIEPRSPRLRSEARLVELRAFFEAMVGRISWDQKRQSTSWWSMAPAGLVRPDPARASAPARGRGRARGAVGRARGAGPALTRSAPVTRSGSA